MHLKIIQKISNKIAVYPISFLKPTYHKRELQLRVLCMLAKRVSNLSSTIFYLKEYATI
ncbi:hypothetical protein X975_07743, partial [Stegodyphus mimosarum]